MPRPITNRTNQSTAFQDATSQENARMKDSFMPKPAVPRLSMCAKASTDSSTSRMNNKMKSKNSSITEFNTGGKLDVGGKIEGSEPKKLAKRRTSGEKKNDAAMMKAGDDATADMKKARSHVESSTTGDILYDKSKRQSFTTENTRPCHMGDYKKTHDEAESARNAIKNKQSECHVFDGKGEEATWRPARAIKVAKASPEKQKSTRTEAEKAGDAAVRAQHEGNDENRRALYKKNHESHVFDNAPVKASGRADNRKNVSTNIFGDEVPAQPATTLIKTSAAKYASNEIFSERPATAQEPVRASRAGVVDRAANCDVFSNKAEPVRTSKQCTNKTNAGSGIFSDKPETVRAHKAMTNKSNTGSLDIFHDKSQVAPSKYSANVKNQGNNIFGGGAFESDATTNRRPVNHAPAPAPRPMSAAGSGRDMSVADRKASQLRGSGGLW